MAKPLASSRSVVSAPVRASWTVTGLSGPPTGGLTLAGTMVVVVTVGGTEVGTRPPDGTVVDVVVDGTEDTVVEVVGIDVGRVPPEGGMLVVDAGTVEVVTAATGVVVDVGSTDVGDTPPPNVVVVVAGSTVVVVAKGTAVVDVGTADVGETPPPNVVVVVAGGTVVVVASGTVVVVASGAVVVVVARGTVVVDVGTTDVGETPPSVVVVVASGAVVVVVVGGWVVLVVGGGVVVVTDGVGVVVGVVTALSFVKVASVKPEPMRTTTLPPAMLAVPTRRLDGATEMSETCTPLGTSSDTETLVATGNDPATAQYPPGPGPAGTATVFRAARKVNSVPTAIPAPATLHTFKGASSARFTNVTTVCVETSPATTVTSAVRVASVRLISRSAGKVRTSTTETPSTAVSTTVARPALSSNGLEQAPTGTVTRCPLTSNSKSPATNGPSASLQISMKPVLPPWASTAAGMAAMSNVRAIPAATDRPVFL